MKKLLKIFMLMMVVSLPVVLSSCGDDKDDEPEGPVSAIVGTWGTSVTDESGTTLITYTFRKDGLLVARFNKESSILDDDKEVVRNGSYVYTASANHLSMQGPGLEKTVKCVIDHNTMTWTDANGVVTVLIK